MFIRFSIHTERDSKIGIWAEPRSVYIRLFDCFVKNQGLLRGLRLNFHPYER